MVRAVVHNLRLASLLLLAVMAFAAAPPKVAAEVTRSSFLSTFHDPCPHRSGCTENVYAINLAGGQTYVIDLTSRDFDAYVYLEDSARAVLAQDDDGGVGLNARIVFTARYTGTHYVVVTSYRSGASGNYALRVSP